jgi:crotonobetainyl-CoA:carnitine CoA-transferase CaiB-like acyl-CoA transferase
MELFEGLKVVDCSSVLAGPQVGTFFAELGAHVIKFENAKTNGDVTRTWHTPSESKDKISSYYSSINYKKEIRFVDLTNEKDIALIHSELETADIVLSNFKGSDATKFQLNAELLSQKFPRLIQGVIRGFEFEKDRVAYDVVLQAETGFMFMNGSSDGPPTKMPVALIDVLAAHHLKEGILCALIQKAKTGKGSCVEVSLEKAALASLANQASYFLMTGNIPQRLGSLHPNIAPYGELFQTQDKKWVVLAIGSDTQFKKLCLILNDTNASSDIRFSSNTERVKHRIVLKEMLQKAFDQISCSDFEIEAQESGVPYGRVRNMKEVFERDAAVKNILHESIEGSDTQRLTSVAFSIKPNN